MIEIFTKPDFLRAEIDGQVRRLAVAERRRRQRTIGPQSVVLDLERREVDDDALVHATTLDPLSLNPVAITQFVKTPDRWTSVSPRVDYQLNQNHTVTARSRFTAASQENAGAGGLALASRAYGTSLEEQVPQVADTALLSARAVNETRFQFVRLSSAQESGSALPAVFVLGAFTGGGAQLGRASNVQDRYELQNYSTVLTGAHSLRFGLRARAVTRSEVSPQNFGGSFTFSGGSFAPALDGSGMFVAVDSLERYRRTLLFLQEGFAPDRIRELGGGASLFTIAAGNPRANVSQ